MTSIAANLERVQNEVADACARAGRDAVAVRMMAVSKVHPLEALMEAYAAGQRLFGENRVQEWQGKAAAITAATGAMAGLEMHLIGPLQSNKTTKAAELFQAVDTVNELKTAQRLAAAAQALGRVLPVLVEVKLSPEESKHGCAPEALPELLAVMATLPGLAVRGLMTVPPFDEDAETARPYFRRLRELRDEHQQLYPTLVELSMGMSGDFRVAIEEGSTCVRVGTAIFGRRSYA